MPMINFSRRDLLKAGMGMAALSCFGCGRRPESTTARRRATTARRPAGSAPEYFVIIHLHGGFDALLTTDPKLSKDVAPKYDFLADSSQILDAGFPIGPHFAPIQAKMNRIAVLNGVAVQTANHPTGDVQTACLRTKVAVGTPPIVDLLGWSSPGPLRQTLGSAYLGAMSFDCYSGAFFGNKDRPGDLGEVDHDPTQKGTFEYLDETPHEDLLRMAKAMRSHRGSAKRASLTEQQLLDLTNVERAAAVFERYGQIDPFKRQSWSEDPKADNIARNLQRTAWLLEQDLAKAVFLRIGISEWDSHWNNAKVQEKWNGAFFNMFSRFLAGLEARSNGGGTLADQTVIVVLSEIGRNGMINDVMGKDHFPEIPVLFYGKGVRGGSLFGETGTRMEALPISPLDGKRATAGGFLPLLDDVGTTLLRWAGMDPPTFGYHGRDLRFLDAV